MLGAGVVGIVMSANFAASPYIHKAYDFYDQVASTVEVVIMLLGILVWYRAQLGLNGQDFSFLENVEAVAWTSICVTMMFGFYAAANDYKLTALRFRAQRQRRTRQLLLKSSIFRTGSQDAEVYDEGAQLIMGYAEKADEHRMGKLRAAEAVLKKVERQFRGGGGERVERYAAQLSSTPELLDWLALSTSVASSSSLKTYVSSLLESAAQADAKADTMCPASAVFPQDQLPLLAFWMNEAANDAERATIIDLLGDLGKYRQTLSPGLIERSLGALYARMQGAMAAGRAMRGNKSQLLADALADATESADTSIAGEESKGTRTRVGPGLLSSKMKAVRKSLAADKGLMTRMQLENKLNNVMHALLDDMNCEACVLIPIEGHEFTPLPSLVVDNMGDSLSAETEQIRRSTDWLCTEGSPSAVCKQSAEPVIVQNIYLDRRFASSKTMVSTGLRVTHSKVLPPGDALANAAIAAPGIESLSQLCVPVLVHGDGDDAERTIVGVIKCLNKMSYSGDRSGVPFRTPSDVEMALSYAAIIAEISKVAEESKRLASAKSSLLAAVKSVATTPAPSTTPEAVSPDGTQ